MTDKLKLAELLMRPYRQRIMNNVHRSEYVECLVALALEDTWNRQEHWSEHDFTHKQSGKRLDSNSPPPGKLGNKRGFAIAIRIQVARHG